MVVVAKKTQALNDSKRWLGGHWQRFLTEMSLHRPNLRLILSDCCLLVVLKELIEF